jgi:hypothetical protein
MTDTDTPHLTRQTPFGLPHYHLPKKEVFADVARVRFRPSTFFFPTFIGKFHGLNVVINVTLGSPFMSVDNGTSPGPHKGQIHYSLVVNCLVVCQPKLIIIRDSELAWREN